MPTTLPDGFLRDLRQRLEAHYGARLVRAVLFGSYARGEATEDSDVDVLVLLEGDVDTWTESKPLSEITLDLILEYGEVVSFVAVDREIWERGWSFIQNVQEDGVSLVA